MFVKKKVRSDTLCSSANNWPKGFTTHLRAFEKALPKETLCGHCMYIDSMPWLWRFLKGPRLSVSSDWGLYSICNLDSGEKDFVLPSFDNMFGMTGLFYSCAGLPSQYRPVICKEFGEAICSDLFEFCVSQLFSECLTLSLRRLSAKGSGVNQSPGQSSGLEKLTDATNGARGLTTRSKDNREQRTSLLGAGTLRSGHFSSDVLGALPFLREPPPSVTGRSGLHQSFPALDGVVVRGKRLVVASAIASRNKEKNKEDLI